MELLGSFEVFGSARRALWLLYLCLVCVGVGQAMLFVILPPAAREIGLEPFQVSAIFATSATIWFFMSPRWGRRSDRVGRRPILLIGLLGFAASMIFLALTIHYALRGAFTPLVAFALLVASRCVFAVFGSGTPPASQAYVADRTSREERTRGVALINAAFGTGQTLGPAVGAGFVVFGLVAPIYVSAVLAIASAGIVWRFLPESEVQVPEKKVEASAPLRFTDSRITPFVVIAICMQAVRSTTTITLAFFLQDMLALTSVRTTELAGVGFMILAIAGLGAQFVIVQRRQIGPARLIQVGLVFGVLAFIIFAVGETYTWFALALCFLGIGLGLVRPGNSAGASLSVRADEQGAVGGITSAIGVVGNIFGPLLGTILYEFSPRGPYLLNGLVLGLALVFSLVHPRLRRLQV